MSASFRKYRHLFVYCGFSLVGIFLLYIAGNKLLQIEHVQVEGNNVLVQIDESKIAKNLLFFPIDTTRQEILEQNPLVGDVQLQKKYPHTLVIVASKRNPVARLPSQGVLWEVDKTGMVLGPSSESSTLPFIDIPLSTVQVGEKVKDKRVVSSISFVTAVSSFLNITKVEVYDSSSLSTKIAKTNILFTQKEDQSTVADTLQTLFSGFRIKGTLPTRIDVRFDKPIVAFD